ncbi:hypothetical protein R3P38DRAFT_2589325 [Favolaschia claudopus]|uniref:Uncharacterized protein n=1 Tax=Favolaschia claudopus TaxID=2862362 RepID=A0AAV9Z1M1_9AGAR
MIVVALQYRRAIREFTSDESNGLQQFMLTSLEWTVLEDLRYILGSFKDATLFFSRDSATLATVIPAMDKLDALLATAVIKIPAGDRAFSVPIAAALLKAKHTLNRYYSLAYYSRVYRIALILHPRYKTGYLSDNEWDAEDIARAKEELQEVFDMYKDAYDAAVLPEGDEEQESTVR